MTTFWIILVILFLVYLNSKKVRETVNSFFGRKSKRGGFNKGGFDSKKSRTYTSSGSSSSRSSGRNYEKYNHSQSSQYGSSYNDFNNNYYNDENVNSSSYNMFLGKILEDIKDDFSSNPYLDKFILEEHYVVIGYRFENGRTIKIKNNMTIEDTYQGRGKRAEIKPSDLNNFVDFFKILANISTQRNGRRSNNNYSWNTGSSSGHSNPFEKRDTTKYTEEQLKYQEKFYKLKKTHDARMAQLNGMSKSNPDRPALVNEINVVKRKMKVYFEKSGLKLKRKRRQESKC